MTGNDNNAVPIWVSNGIAIEEVANATGYLQMLKSKVDIHTQSKIDDLVTDLKTYSKYHEIHGKKLPATA